ncbi:MAG TPA: DUF4350 domain-containing protein [Croceibacterium sp.]|nr:DUF4350 domain-containing protein [Croceibacterium sp.]
MRPSLWLAAALLPLASACQAREAEAPQRPELPALGLMGTIPIYWGEADAFGDVLNGRNSVHWARAQLERSYRLEPLDTLDAASLAPLDFLLLAQPRALTPAENVALDEWVRQGGRVLLFADPMLTGNSRFAIGDRRRPQDVVLLSPILSHWGLRLEFDVERPEGVALLDAGGARLPVNRPGRLAADSAADDCAIDAEAVLARCRIGEGEALVIADAALLDLYQPHPGSAAALAWLTREGFAESGEIAGRAPAGGTVRH